MCCVGNPKDEIILFYESHQNGSCEQHTEFINKRRENVYINSFKLYSKWKMVPVRIGFV